MTDPTPTPAPDLAAPKPHTAKFTGQYYRDLANGTKGVDSETFEDALNHAAYLADLAAASRPAPPAPAGEVGELVERCRSAVKFGAINRDLLNACAAALTAQAAALAAAEAGAREAEKWIPPPDSGDDSLYNVRRLRAELRAAESACTALRERVGELEGHLSAVLRCWYWDAGDAVDAARAALSASPVPQPAPATAMPEWKFPRADERDVERGWTICTDFINDIQNLASAEYREQLPWEGIESVLLAVEAHYAAPADTGKGEGE